MTLLEVFRSVRSLLADPKAWVRGVHSGKRQKFTALGGIERESIVALWAHQDGVDCFCLLGAIDRVSGFGGNLDTSARIALARTLFPLFTGVQLVTAERMVAAYNDAPGRTHADVLGVVDATIARLEAA